jgi:hypothetical protein
LLMMPSQKCLFNVLLFLQLRKPAGMSGGLFI